LRATIVTSFSGVSCYEVLEGVKAETAMASIFQAISDGPNLSFLQHFPGIFSDYGHMLASIQILYFQKWDIRQRYLHVSVFLLI